MNKRRILGLTLKEIKSKYVSPEEEERIICELADQMESGNYIKDGRVYTIEQEIKAAFTVVMRRKHKERETEEEVQKL